MHFVRSPYAHAKILSIDVSAALGLPGVFGTLTGDEVAILTDPFFQITTPRVARARFALAVGKVRYAGEAVVAVAAATRELARDAADVVEVDYDRSPSSSTRGSRWTTRHRCCTRVGSNLSWTGVYEWGNLGAAFEEADHVVRIDELHFNRFNSTPIECDGALVEYNRGTGQWTIHTNNQFPGFAAIMMGPALRVGLDKLRFVTQDIGGGFGRTRHLSSLPSAARPQARPAVQWTGGARTSTSPCRTGTSAGSMTSRWP